uniref:CSON011023 protein n=1 Tax=Culicoides sonorensis TaxID=179676 RepID=A0A336M8A0_CULSO
MSGDVQPRKRKDKSKKRKDDDEPILIREKRSSSEHSPDMEMHIEKESETGGHWCAKIVFFALLSILIGLIALIIIENRGMTEVAQPQGESRFSEYFEGWVEEPKDHDEDHVVHSLHDDHDDGEDDDDHGHDDDNNEVYEEENLSQQDDEDEKVPVSQEEGDDDDDAVDDEPQVSQEQNDEVRQSQEQDETPENDDDDDEVDQNVTKEQDATPASAENDNDDDGDQNVSAPEDVNLNDGDLPFEEETAPDSTEQFFDNDVGEELFVKRLSEEKIAKSKETTKSAENDETPEKSSETFDNIDPLFDDDFNEANDNIEKNPKKALKLFEKLLKYRPDSQKLLLGKANALNQLSNLYQDNGLLREAIQIYEKLLLDKKIMIKDDAEYEKVGVVCVDRMTFLGNFYKAIELQKVLVDRFPQNPEHRNQLAIIYLMINRLSEAKHILHETLLKWRHNAVALVHYGFVLKQLDNNLEHAVIFLREGIESGEPGTQEGLFYMNLGDALMRLGRSSEALSIYTEGANRGLFLSAYQRSLYNIDRLKAQSFWELEETSYSNDLKKLQKHWRQILKEGVSALNQINGFSDESENLRDHGEWKQFELYARGRRNVSNCKSTPMTCDLIEKFPAASTCKRGQVKYSIMQPKTHVWAHTGPTNCRLRAHLGLKVPQGTFLRVGNETKSWKEGEWLIFDDSFEHEVWHNGTESRLVLIVDIWHPEITEEERKTLTAI